jgi:hypothetical protein
LEVSPNSPPVSLTGFRDYVRSRGLEGRTKRRACKPVAPVRAVQSLVLAAIRRRHPPQLLVPRVLVLGLSGTGGQVLADGRGDGGMVPRYWGGWWNVALTVGSGTLCWTVVGVY